jgi:DHA1 family bicyclomycin/chloramphenicol resistance-like MFS transporter
MKRQAGRIETILILGALSAFAPLSIDMYLPAMPAISADLGATQAQVQWTLAAFFLGFAGGQAFYGPLADRFGRTPPLVVGLILFALSSAACAFVPSIEAMVGLRLVEALGACAGGVIARALVRDLFPAKEGARIFSLLMLVTGLAPIIAPIIGSYLMLWLGWRSIFWVLAAAGAASLAAVLIRLPEGHRGTSTHSLAVIDILKRYRDLAMDRHYSMSVLAGTFSISGMFAYIAGSPFVFIEHFGLPPQRFGWIFAANAVGITLASQINGHLSRNHAPAPLMWAALRVQVAAGAVLIGAAATGAGGMWGIVGPQWVFVACIGATLPNSAALAMERYGHVAGSASALLGTVQFAGGAFVALLMGAIHAILPLPMTLTMGVCGLLAALTFWPIRRGVRTPPPIDRTS